MSEQIDAKIIAYLKANSKREITPSVYINFRYVYENFHLEIRPSVSNHMELADYLTRCLETLHQRCEILINKNPEGISQLAIDIYDDYKSGVEMEEVKCNADKEFYAP